MFLTVHAAAGAVLGRYLNNPLLAFLLGAASHFVLDMIPHGDESIQRWPLFKTRRRRIIAAAVIDFLILSVFLAFWVKGSAIHELPSMLAGAAGGIFPDTLWGFHELTGTPLLDWYEGLHSRIHYNFRKRKVKLKQGLLLQIPILIILTWILV